ncbi:hypothetical protein CLOACE_09780 [Clostridium acetireducens DSM 10703]|uniref:Spo0E like sporulation regulatory protein n=1 Tax=Clostridium acetireducens DSM 10703 TaxID=1121290 RepID=A0A1E8EZD8_9CLOT|nr:aspartyl-phosphate phosphatase Spo0E family protein [Clostridium acetireducens]OFI06478.1 hypothetical protein CLOACE_09780 [Clostridium acetireducens DSM 10703]
MSKEDIENLRKTLNEISVTLLEDECNINKEEILKLSKNMDDLIVDYMKNSKNKGG